VGGTTEKPPKDACYARLIPDAAPLWTTGRIAIEREYSVGRRVCQYDPIYPVDPGQVVLASNARTGTKAEWIKALPTTGKVRLTWAVDGWPGFLDIQGGFPLLVENGTVVAPATCGSYFCDKNPRTGVGYDADTNKVYFITVDGRMDSSVGMTLPQFAQQFKRYGADWALNLDGGGSTTMVAKIPGSGLEVVNKPSAGAERHIPSAMLILPGADSGEPGSLGGAGILASAAGLAAESDLGATDPEAALEEAITDPGSTGGLLSALANGGLGYEGLLDPELQAIADHYEAARRAAGEPA
jgi:hypothetical protein